MPQPRQKPPLLGKARKACRACQVRADQLDRHRLGKASVVALGAQHLPHAAARDLARHAPGADPLGNHVRQAEGAGKAGGLQERGIAALQREQFRHPRAQGRVLAARRCHKRRARGRIFDSQRLLDHGKRAGVLGAHAISP